MQREPRFPQNVFQPDDGMQRDQRGGMRLGIKADHGAVGDEATGAFTAKTRLAAAAAANESGTRQIGHADGRFFGMGMDHSDSQKEGQRGSVSPPGKSARDPGQSNPDDNNFAVTDFSRSGSRHNLGAADF